MRARLLKKILNNTGYAISNHDKYIAVGSPMCHDLITVNKETLTVKFALDTFNQGRKYVAKSGDELLFIWDKLHELIKSGEITNIINGKDEIENPLPVFTVKDGRLVESVTDAYGWPNTDDDGICMYENTHFPTQEQAIEYGIREDEVGVEWMLEQIEEKEKEISEIRAELEKYRANIRHLKGIQADLLPGNNTFS